jgi:hypothetical protein
MNILDINLKIKEDLYPIMFKLKKKELIKISEIIFNTGYQIMYPKIDKTNIKKQHDYIEIINKIDELKKDFMSPQLNDKINSLESSLEKLIGISCSSMKKGEFAENLLENIFSQRYGDITFKKTNTIPHSGDAWLYLPDDKIIMLESKNYNTTINKDELIKMENDMKTNNINWGLFVSFNSNIQGLKEMDYYTFMHNNQIYNIISISNLSIDINRLDLGLTLIRKLINIPNIDLKFPWIIKNIKKDLDDLHEIVIKNYILRDNFLNIEKEINKNLNNYYIKLRDHHYDEENKINQIIKSLNSTMEESVLIDLENKYKDILEFCNHKDKKLFIIINKIIDCIPKNISIINNGNIWNIQYNQDIIGIIKVQTKKIILELSKYELIISFVIGKDKENIGNLIIIENLLKICN